MKISCIRTLLLLATALCLVRCSPDVDDFIPDPSVMLVGNVHRLMDTLRLDIGQRTMINADFPTAVVTPRKTVLIFQPNSLTTGDGTIATGFVEIEIVELLTKGEILLYGVPTNSRERLLTSAGEFYIRATQNGQHLHLIENKPVRILTDITGTDPDDRVELFYGVEDGPNPIDTTNLFTWEEADKNPSTWDNVDDTEWVALADSQQIITGFGYESFSDSLDWINFDVFWNIAEPNKADICVTLPEEYGNVNTRVFLVFEDRNSVVNMPGNPASKQFCNYYGNFTQLSVPVGEKIKIVVLAERGVGEYYFALVSAILEHDHEVLITPVRTSLEQIRNAVLAL